VWLPGRGWLRVDPTSAVAPTRIESGVRELARQSGSAPLFALGAGSEYIWSTALRRLRFNWEAMENSWNQWVLTYSAYRQLSLLDDLGFEPDWRVLGILLALAVSVVAGVLAVVSLRHRTRRDPLAEIEARFRGRLERGGLRCHPAEGLRALAQRLAAELSPASCAEADGIITALDRWRYSPASARVPPAAIRRLASQVRRFRVHFAD
jgi:hypothetical protein